VQNCVQICSDSTFLLHDACLGCQFFSQTQCRIIGGGARIVSFNASRIVLAYVKRHLHVRQKDM